MPKKKAKKVVKKAPEPLAVAAAPAKAAKAAAAPPAKEEKKKATPEVKKEVKKDAVVAKKGKKEEPKKEAKEPKEGAVTPEQTAKLTAAAMEEILKTLAAGDAEKGTQGMPENWHITYKLALGSYKKFCKKQTEKLVVVDRENGNFIVAKKGAANLPAPPPPGQLWKKHLANAWNSYCKAFDKEDRSVENFINSLPKGAKDSKPDGAAPAKAAPKAAPAKGGDPNPKKRKAEEEVKEEESDDEEEEEVKPQGKLKAKKRKGKAAREAS